MQQESVRGALIRDGFPDVIVDRVLNRYIEAVGEFKKKNWKYCINEIGHFVEDSRRLIDYRITGSYVPLNDEQSAFSEAVLSKWNDKNNTESVEYKVIIPRMLYAIFCIRNKRGSMHSNHIDPNEMDATISLNGAKWVLSEFFRLSSKLSFVETKAIVESIMKKETSLVWDVGSHLRILNAKMSTSEKILCLLYLKDDQSVEDLRKSTDYKNKSNFVSLLKKLHNDVKINFENGMCKISPTGEEVAETLFIKYEINSP